MFHKKMQASVTRYGDLTFKTISFYYVLGTVIVSQIAVLWLTAQEHLFPGAEVMQSMAGTFAEIIAGLYGITMASYTFFLSRMDSLMTTDATLDYVVNSLKSRFKHLIWYISVTFLGTLATCLLLMYYPASSGLIPEYFYRLICNECLLFLAFSVVLILYYSISVIDPKSISKEAERLKRKLCRRTGVTGSVAEFIALYDQIEETCYRMLPQSVLRQLQDNKGKRLEYAVDLLWETKPDLRPVLTELIRIHRYYECMVNCSPMTVSLDMCVQARQALQYLEKKVPAK